MKLSKKDKIQIKEWVKALRSGKYKQTKGQLQDDKGYCCLGVACDLFIPNKKKVYAEAEPMSENDESQSTGLLYGGLPSDQSGCPNWLQDVSNVNFRLADGLTDIYELTSLNDNKGLTFKEIADIIEKQLLT